MISFFKNNRIYYNISINKENSKVINCIYWWYLGSFNRFSNLFRFRKTNRCFIILINFNVCLTNFVKSMYQHSQSMSFLFIFRICSKPYCSSQWLNNICCDRNMYFLFWGEYQWTPQMSILLFSHKDSKLFWKIQWLN